MSNKRVQDWHKSAAIALQSVKPIRSDKPFTIEVTFWRDTERKFDLDNSYSSVADALVKAGVIEDDNMTILNPVILKHGGKDKLNPRAEVKIYE